MMPDDLTYIPIEKLLQVARADLSPIAIDRRGTHKTWRDWQHRVERATQGLMVLEGKIWALYCEDAYEFSIWLFALLHANKVVYLPGNSLPGTRQVLAASVDGFLGDFQNANQVPSAGAADHSVDWSELSLDRTCIYLFTSGSTGEPALIPKTLGQLSREIKVLHQLWGAEIAQSLVIGSVSHQHIYGLLFRVLWPLAAGNVFMGEMTLYSEKIFRRIEDNHRVVLVTSPSHLTRLPEHLNWPSLGKKLCRVFSSTGPLGYDEAQKLQTLIGVYATEVYGSSETGGVAYRKQTDKNQPWKLLPGIQYQIEPETQRLQLRSPHVSLMAAVQQGQVPAVWYSSDDKAEAKSETEFFLKGRLDTIEKIEGKRISLTQIERQLEQNKYVDSGKVLSYGMPRARLMACVCLSAEGQVLLETEGKRGLNETLVAALRGHFEAVVLPRKFRYFTELPTNLLGKVTHAALTDLCGVNIGRGKLPDVQLFTKLSEQEWQLDLIVPEDLNYFAGHFEGQPILPGVAMLFWTEHFGRALFQLEGAVQIVQKLKFQQVVRPQTRVVAKLKFVPSRYAIEFSFQSSIGTHGSGRVVFQGSL